MDRQNGKSDFQMANGCAIMHGGPHPDLIEVFQKDGGEYGKEKTARSCQRARGSLKDSLCCNRRAFFFYAEELFSSLVSQQPRPSRCLLFRALPSESALPSRLEIWPGGHVRPRLRWVATVQVEQSTIANTWRTKLNLGARRCGGAGVQEGGNYLRVVSSSVYRRISVAGHRHRAAIR